MSPPFLSDAWFDALEHVLEHALEKNRGDTEEPGGSTGQSDERLAIGQLVTGAPSGDVGYTIVVGGNMAPELHRGGLALASVTLVCDYRTARAIASGTERPGTALGEGRLKVRGDANVLLRARATLAAIAPALASLAGETDI